MWKRTVIMCLCVMATVLAYAQEPKEFTNAWELGVYNLNVLSFGGGVDVSDTAFTIGEAIYYPNTGRIGFGGRFDILKYPTGTDLYFMAILATRYAWQKLYGTIELGGGIYLGIYGDATASICLLPSAGFGANLNDYVGYRFAIGSLLDFVKSGIAFRMRLSSGIFILF